MPGSFRIIPHRRRAHARRRRRGRAAHGQGRRALAWLVLGVAFLVGFAGARTLVGIDQELRKRFEGTLFRVPSRVFAAPLILYPGADFERLDLAGTLKRLGYRPAPEGAPLDIGRYHWGPDGVRLHRRAFDHPDRSERTRKVHIQFRRRAIKRIVDMESGRDIEDPLLIEPEYVGAYYGGEHEQRDLVKLANLPAHLAHAVLAVEDQRFYEHLGLDPRRIGGALLANLRSMGIAEGGSTITQQLAKNFFLTPERTLRRKLSEAIMAGLMEWRYEKPRILEAYLNEIYLGQRGGVEIHGVGEASRRFFGKHARDLLLHESALLAAIIQQPNALSPHRNPEAARGRRDLVLRLMHQQGRIEAAAMQSALEQPIVMAALIDDRPDVRYFLDHLRRRLPEFYDAATLTTEGLRIYSTLDIRLQQAAQRALSEELAGLEARYPELQAGEGEAPLQGCLVALDNNGRVLALVGGRDYRDNQYNRCTLARRPAGSVFKTFVYAAALAPEKKGGPALLTLADRLDDSPLRVKLPAGQGNWEPRNFDREFHGVVGVREALERSYNVAAARLGQRVGIHRVAEMATRLGIESELPRVPSLAIGAADITPLELARAYATLAGRGVRPQLRPFEDVVDPEKGAAAVERRDIKSRPALDAGAAYLVTSLLQGVAERGTARSLKRHGVSGALAVKTGTSSDERDAWLVGFTPERVVAVWVGFDTPRSLGRGASAVALPVWARFVRDVTGGRVEGAFNRPQNIVERDINPDTGALALPGCRRRSSEIFIEGAEPRERCPTLATPEGRGTGRRDAAPEKEGWLGRGLRRLRRLIDR